MDIKKGLLQNFVVTNNTDTMPNGIFEFQMLNLKNSRLILFFDDDPEAGKSSYIHKGEINDSEVDFVDGIKVGMTKEDFMNNFFDHFPNELAIRHNVIIFESCVDDITHTYTFKNGKLESVGFVTDSYWIVNYDK